MELSKLLTLASKLDHLNYYKLLGLKRDAELSDIRRAYHQRARSLHPDRYHEHPDQSIRDAIDKIFKRVAEAYTVLRDPEKRKIYDKQIDDPTSTQVRYTEESELALKEEKKAATGRTAQGRKFYEEAQRQHQNGDFKKALQALKMALTFERDNEHFQELLAQWQDEPQTT